MKAAENNNSHVPSTGSRRDFLSRLGGGFGGVALAGLLNSEGLLASPPTGGGVLYASGGPQRIPKAKRVVQLYMSGAASQCDTFDYKPLLIKQHGKPWDPGEKVELFQSSPGSTLASPWAWKRCGKSGKMINDCVAPLGECVDEMAFVHNMVSKSNVHGPATFMQATGFILPGFPSAGAWVSYGLGSLSENLPTFVVLPDPRGYAPNGPRNWGAGFLPAEHQGTAIRPGATNPIADLFPPAGSYVTPDGDRDVLAALQQVNRAHAADREGDSRLDARIRSYELAAKMQLSAPEVLDISGEPEYIREMYGLNAKDTPYDGPMNPGEEARNFGRNCLTARRLLERGVRFVQIWSGADNGFPRRNWDSHEDLARDHWPLGRGMATGAAALIKDLKQRGMLDDTVILWTTEFGRMPCSQGNKGRDHNPFVFTNWLAGGGIKGGVTYGESDEWSYKPADPSRATYCYDVHATLLHLLGIDHKKLTFRHNGIDRRLTDVHGEVIRELLA
ncbi:MAG: arylsulfatase family protein [Phycisphaerales bacterium]|nr:arylsulfatase family protein [Phycisphaerales bacterium]